MAESFHSSQGNHTMFLSSEALVTTLPYHKVIVRMGCFGGDSPILACIGMHCVAYVML